MTTLPSLPTFTELEIRRIDDLIERVIRPKRLPIGAYLYGTARSVARCMDVEIGPPEGWKQFYRSTRDNLRGDA